MRHAVVFGLPLVAAIAECVYTVSENYRDIRVELSVPVPGTLWPDDVRIERAWRTGPTSSAA